MAKSGITDAILGFLGASFEKGKLRPTPLIVTWLAPAPIGLTPPGRVGLPEDWFFGFTAEDIYQRGFIIQDAVDAQRAEAQRVRDFFTTTNEDALELAAKALEYESLRNIVERRLFARDQTTDAQKRARNAAVVEWNARLVSPSNMRPREAARFDAKVIAEWRASRALAGAPAPARGGGPAGIAVPVPADDQAGGIAAALGALSEFFRLNPPDP